MEPVDRHILVQVIAESAEPVLIVRVDHSEWPVALSNQAFAAIGGEQPDGKPFADVIEEMVGRELALEISEAVRSFRLAAEAGSLEGLESLAVVVPGDPEADHAAVRDARRAWARSVAVSPPEPLVPDPGHARPRVGYVSSFFQDANWMKPIWAALRHHDREAVDLYPSVETHGALGGIYFKLASPIEAAEQFRKALQLDPDNADLWIDLANAEQLKISVGRAWSAITKARQVEPGIQIVQTQSGLYERDASDPNFRTSKGSYTHRRIP